MVTLDNIPVPCDGFAIRELGNEIIFIADAGDELHSLDETGTFIWRNIDGSNSLSIILESICDEYEVERSRAEKDLKKFIRKLKEKGLVVLRK